MSIWHRPFNFLMSLLSERFYRISRSLICREEITTAEYQYWFDRNPRYTHEGNVERLRLIRKLNEPGSTNDVYLAKSWLETRSKRILDEPKDIVVKICIPYAPPGPDRHHRITMIQGAFYDEIRINNLVRSTNIDGVIRPLGGGQSGHIFFFRLEYLKGDTLENFIKPPVTKEDFWTRVSQLAYLANTISQLHHYRIVHMDLKPKNLFMCLDENSKNYNKILVFDFGFSNSQLRDTVTEYGGLLTPIYSAPEQALMARNLSRGVDYFSFGIIAHEYLTGIHLFPKALPIFIEDNYRITERYLDTLRNGGENQLTEYPELLDIINKLTLFDSIDRLQQSEDLFSLANTLSKMAQENGIDNENTAYLEKQYETYKRLGSL